MSIRISNLPSATLRTCVTVVLFCVCFFASQTLQAQTTGFTYQGKLGDAGSPANGSYDFQFKLFDASTGGTQQGLTLSSTNTVTNGGFTVQLDFGANFPGAGRYLEVSVRVHSANPDAAYSTLSPRQQIGSTPYAIRSLSAATADNVGGVVPIANGGTGSGTQNFVDLTSNQTNIGGNKTFTGTLSGNGSGLTNVPATVADGSITTSKLADGSVTANKLASNVVQNSGSHLALVATLRWDLLARKDFPVGASPEGIAFDGANIWVTNKNGLSVTKLRASDGACVGTCTFLVGVGPQGIAFDGANIWTANSGGNEVTRLRASDGACVAPCTFAVGVNPQEIAFDGASIWVTNSGSNNVTKLRASDGQNQGTFTVGTAPMGIAFDGANMWVANSGSANVTKLRATDGTTLATFFPCTFQNGFCTGALAPREMVFDGVNMWITIPSGNPGLVKWEVSGNSQTFFSYPITAKQPFSSPFGIAFDGANIWVANNGSNIAIRLRGDAVNVFDTTNLDVGIAPHSVAFDGANVWIVNNGSNSVTRLPITR